jgi:hypothetical protein
MKFIEAQKDMRNSYFGGAPGAFASGVVWLTAGIIALLSTKQISVMVFFFGGTLIHPVGILLSRALKRSGKHKKGNPLSHLALESIFMFIYWTIYRLFNTTDSFQLVFFNHDLNYRWTILHLFFNLWNASLLGFWDSVNFDRSWRISF